MKLPKKLQSVLWSVNIDNLNLDRDKYYIIHQILSFGSLDEISWLFSNYPKKEIIEVFMVSYKDYFRPRFYFIKDALMGLKNWHPDERNYVKNIPRAIEQ